MILSLSGGAISSSAVNNISFELESLSSGLERPTYWVTGDAQALSGFAYLVKPGVTANQKVGLDSLYSDFNELAGTNRALAADGVITASELSGVSLWFDKDTDAFIDAGELVSLNALPNFTVTVPEVVARAASSGEITPLYEAKASWTGAPTSGGALFAVAIPYKTDIALAPATPSGNTAYATKPTAKVTVLGDTLSASSTAVPEDLAGGIKSACAKQKIWRDIASHHMPDGRAGVERTQPRFKRAYLIRLGDIGLTEDQPIRNGGLLHRFNLAIQRGGAEYRVHYGHHAIQAKGS